MTTELERKIQELTNFPAHQLGLDGWLLRSIPRDARNTFLKEFEKALKVAFHPDRVQTLSEKQRRESYLQTISNAVATLSSDAQLYDLATEDVPTKRNPLVGMKNALHAHQEEIRVLQAEIEQQKGDLCLGERGRQKLEVELQRLDEFTGNVVYRLQEQDGYTSIKNYMQWALKTIPCYPVHTPQALLVWGRKMGVQRTIDDYKPGTTHEEIFLFEEAHKRYPSFEAQQAGFKEAVEKSLLYTEPRTHLFVNGVSYSGDESFTLLGSLPAPVIDAYAVHHNLPVENIKRKRDINFHSSRLYRTLLFFGEEGSPEHRKYTKRITPFVVPFVSPDTPTLVSARNNRGGVRYELLFTPEVTSFPKGTELDFWFDPHQTMRED